MRRRDSGRWQARVRDPLDGRLVSLGTYSTKVEAERALASGLTEQASGGWVRPGAGTPQLEQYANAWLRDRAGLRPRTRELYEGLLRLHILPQLGGLDLSALSPMLVRRWFADLAGGGRPGRPTAAKSYRLLRTILGTAVEDGLLAKNPCGIRGAGQEHAAERPVIPVDTVWRLADAVSPRYRALVLTAAFTGLRRGELFGLTRTRLDLAEGTVTVAEQRQQLRDGTLVVGPPKTKAGERTITLPPVLVTELQHHLDRYAEPGENGLVFVGEKGGPLRDHVWQKHWAAARRAVGVPQLHFHDLRHVANTLTAAAGASTRELMYRMGHASSAAAIRYQHATRQRDAELADRLSQRIARPDHGIEL